MFSHFHKLTTELFNSIKTQQINVFNASADSNANCLCRTLGAIKSAGLWSAILLNSGLFVAGQWLLWLRQHKVVEKKETLYVTPNTSPVFKERACQWMSNSMIKICTLRCTSCRAHGGGQQSKERSLTDFCGSHRDVVPHVRLPVQRLGQRYLPVVHVDVELPLQVRVPIDEVPARTIYRQKSEPSLFNDPPMQHF